MILICSEATAAKPEVTEALLAREPDPPTLRVTATPDELRQVLREAAAAGEKRVVSAGGDGSLHTIVNALLAEKLEGTLEIAVLPAGTGNDFARSLGLPRSPGECLELAFRGKAWALDVGTAEGEYFINMLSAGMGAEATHRSTREKKNTARSATYWINALLESLEPTAYPVRVASEDWSWAGDVYGLCIGNGRYAGGGACLFPEGSLNDGELDLLVIPAAGKATGPALVGDALRVLARQEPQTLLRRRVPQVHIRCERELPLSMDGEKRAVKSLSVGCLPRRVRFVAPWETEEVP